MLSGRRLDLLDPSPLDVEMEDIAHGLARVARWNGQTEGAHIFSVAQHSLLVEALARAKVPRLDAKGRLAVLLHDAPEFVIGDMISPFKAVIGDRYKAVERRLLAAIHLRFGLPVKLTDELQALIKAADRSAAYLEATQARRFRHHGSAQVLRRAAQVLGHHRARLSHALAGGHGGSPLQGAVRETDARLRLFITGRAGHRYDARIGIDKAIMIHVCSLARLYATVDETGARHIVTLLRLTDRVERPRHIAPENHLVLAVDDISAPMEGYTAPGEEHVARLIDFAGTWDRKTPMVVHCFAGISRSTAGAFVAACAINPERDEVRYRAGDPPRVEDRAAERAHRLHRRPPAEARRPHGAGGRDPRPRRSGDGRPSVSPRFALTISATLPRPGKRGRQWTTKVMAWFRPKRSNPMTASASSRR